MLPLASGAGLAHSSGCNLARSVLIDCANTGKNAVSFRRSPTVGILTAELVPSEGADCVRER